MPLGWCGANGLGATVRVGNHDATSAAGTFKPHAAIVRAFSPGLLAVFAGYPGHVPTPHPCAACLASTTHAHFEAQEGGSIIFEPSSRGGWAPCLPLGRGDPVYICPYLCMAM